MNIREEDNHIKELIDSHSIEPSEELWSKLSNRLDCRDGELISDSKISDTDAHINRVLEGHSIEPSKDLWSNLSDRLDSNNSTERDKGRSKRRGVIFTAWFGVAAAIALLISIISTPERSSLDRSSAISLELAKNSTVEKSGTIEVDIINSGSANLSNSDSTSESVEEVKSEPAPIEERAPITNSESKTIPKRRVDTLISSKITPTTEEVIAKPITESTTEPITKGTVNAKVDKRSIPEDRLEVTTNNRDRTDINIQIDEVLLTLNSESDVDIYIDSDYLESVTPDSDNGIKDEPLTIEYIPSKRKKRLLRKVLVAII